MFRSNSYKAYMLIILFQVIVPFLKSYNNRKILEFSNESLKTFLTIASEKLVYLHTCDFANNIYCRLNQEKHQQLLLKFTWAYLHRQHEQNNSICEFLMYLIDLDTPNLFKLVEVDFRHQLKLCFNPRVCKEVFAQLPAIIVCLKVHE